MARRQLNEYCELCRQKRDLTFHHLIPRKLHRRKGFKKNFDRETLNQGIYVCRLCHKGLHKLYDELTLARLFRDRHSMINDAAIAKHIQWSARQKVAMAGKVSHEND